MIFNDWWEKHYDEIWESAKENGKVSLREMMERCWDLASDSAFIQATQISSSELVRVAYLASSNREVREEEKEGVFRLVETLKELEKIKNGSRLKK